MRQQQPTILDKSMVIIGEYVYFIGSEKGRNDEAVFGSGSASELFHYTFRGDRQKRAEEMVDSLAQGICPASAGHRCGGGRGHRERPALLPGA
jgi:hypothetical protein